MAETTCAKMTGRALTTTPTLPITVPTTQYIAHPIFCIPLNRRRGNPNGWPIAVTNHRKRLRGMAPITVRMSSILLSTKRLHGQVCVCLCLSLPSPSGSLSHLLHMHTHTRKHAHTYRRTHTHTHTHTHTLASTHLHVL